MRARDRPCVRTSGLGQWLDALGDLLELRRDEATTRMSSGEGAVRPIRHTAVVATVVVRSPQSASRSLIVAESVVEFGRDAAVSASEQDELSAQVAGVADPLGLRESLKRERLLYREHQLALGYERYRVLQGIPAHCRARPAACPDPVALRVSEVRDREHARGTAGDLNECLVRPIRRRGLSARRVDVDQHPRQRSVRDERPPVPSDSSPRHRRTTRRYSLQAASLPQPLNGTLRCRPTVQTRIVTFPA